MIAQKAARIAATPAFRAGFFMKSKHRVAMKNVIAKKSKLQLTIPDQSMFPSLVRSNILSIDHQSPPRTMPTVYAWERTLSYIEWGGGRAGLRLDGRITVLVPFL
jgi:hypothetical protein